MNTGLVIALLVFFDLVMLVALWMQRMRIGELRRLVFKLNSDNNALRMRIGVAKEIEEDQ